nr:argonaute 2 [Diatraea saccharalis]
MGRGGKKKGKKESTSVEETTSAVESLTVTETPSTSQGQSIAAVETISTPSVVEVQPQKEVKVEEQKEEEEDGLGLGLGGGKRKPRKRGKKQTASELPVQPVQAQPVQVPPVQAQPVQVPPVQQYPVQAPPTPRSPWQGQQPHSTVPPASSVTTELVGGVPFQSSAPPGFSQPRPASNPNVAQAAGRGRGRGQGRGRGYPQSSGDVTFDQRPGSSQVPSSFQQPVPSSSSLPPTSAVPFRPGPPLATAAAQSQAVAQYAPTVGSGDPLCRYKIPQKILGNTVPVRAIQVITNYLQMTIQPLKIFRYDVTIKPDRPKKALPKAYLISKNKHFRNAIMAFDQMKNCYTIDRLPNVTEYDRFITNVEFEDNNGRIMKFEVSYKFTGIVDLGTLNTYMQSGGTSLNPPTEAIQCIDVILRQGTLESYVKAGRQFFQRPSRPIDLGDGLEMWTGLFQSAIFTTMPFVNIDVAHKGFPRQQPLIEALKRDFRLDPAKALESQRGRAIESFQSFLKGLRVVATIGGDKSNKGQRREFIVNSLVGPATRERFSYEDPNTGAKQSMTVAEYFIRIRGARLQYPDQNCVWVGPREKTIYYPMELLEVAYGQAQNKQLNERQLSTMVRQAATPPDDRKRKIEEVIKNMNYSNNPTFAKFGLKISNQFYPVNAKILKPPTLEVGRGQTLEPRKGVWQANQVYRPEALQSWGFIAIECDPSCDFNKMIDMTMKMGRQMGMTVTNPALTHFNVNIRELQNVLFSALEKNVKFLFIIVSARGRDYYQKVKQLAERDVGILTQCVKEQTAANRMNPQTVKNILLKVNSKLMGINQALDGRCMPKCLKDGGVMVVGADVTHPSPDQTSIPSIAAVTASIDPKCFMYNIELSIQTPKKEMIVEFEDMMVDHLKVYRQHQKVLPKKIFVFRDGVSEGQFAQVMSSELQAVHNAYKTLAGPNAKPEVLFLLVQKRHHTRLFVPNSPDNVDPGTVVDTNIVHASELDFYLVSHQAIKGTARPTRYHAVCNDGQIPHDEVEQLTYYLCHLYSRCMRAVSYPTPTYYAHLACLRARSLTHGEKFDNSALERSPKRLRVMDKILQYSRMFFV